jgi:Concanavalin A-like lectin/glucanases superfamily
MKTRVFTVCVVVFLFCGITHAGLSDGLVAYYPFNGNANDESGNGNNGIVHGATLAMDRFGNANSAYSFDGVNNYIDINKQIVSAVDFTVTFWLKPEAQQKGIVVPISQGHGNFTANTTDGFAVQYGWPTADVMMFIYGDGDGGGTWRVIDFGYQLLSELKWHQLMVSKGGQTITLYKNGVKVATRSDHILVFGNHNFSIGHDTYNAGREFHGSIDDVRIYNRALSEAEIQQIYQGETCSNDVAIKPYTFTAGTPAKAAEINANFDVLYQRINTPRCQ